MFPWEGFVPEADLAAFRNPSNPMDDAPRAGKRPAFGIDMTRRVVDTRYPSECEPAGWTMEANRTGYVVMVANRPTASRLLSPPFSIHIPATSPR